LRYRGAKRRIRRSLIDISKRFIDISKHCFGLVFRLLFPQAEEPRSETSSLPHPQVSDDS
jgi:hypothetical protein